jgi:hypothetical protein
MTASPVIFVDKGLGDDDNGNYNNTYNQYNTFASLCCVSAMDIAIINDKIPFFKMKYQRHTNFAIKSNDKLESNKFTNIMKNNYNKHKIPQKYYNMKR